MKIGILEYHNYHQIYVKTLSKICEGKGREVIIYNNIKDAQKADLDMLFVNSIQPQPIEYAKWVRFKPKCKTILTIHNVNSELMNSIPFRKKILKKFNAINVLYIPIKDYIIKNDIYKGRIYTLPFMVHEKFYPNVNNMYVVPGRIEEHRRDYKWVLDNVDKYEPLCLLGSPHGKYGKYVVDRCERLVREEKDVYFYKDFVPTEEYDRIIKGCKAILAPLRNPTFGFLKLKEEYYGITKGVGAQFEAIRFGKEFICNLDIKMNYKDYLLEKWKKYFEKKIVGEFVNA